MGSINHLVTGSTSSNNSVYGPTDFTPNLSFTPTAGAVLILAVHVTGTAQEPTITDTQTLGWTKIVTSLDATLNNGAAYIFISDSAAAASVTTITVDVTGDAGTGCNASVSEAIDVTLTPVQFKAAGTGFNSANPITVTMDSAILTENPVIGAVFRATSGLTVTEPTDWTEIAESSFTTPSNAIEVAKRDSGETGTSITWTTSAANSWRALIVEFAASDGAAYVPHDHFGTLGMFGV